MKLMIASDIHGSALYCGQMLRAYEREGAQRLLLLGDILYHGPRNDLPEGYAPKEVIAMLNPLKEDLLCVRGNCDTEVDQMVLDFPIMAEYCLLELPCTASPGSSGTEDGGAGRHGMRLTTVFATHGHVYSPSSPPPFVEFVVMLNGHTHISALEDMGAFYYVNPGSISIPKGDTEHSYAVYENGCFTLHRLRDGAETGRMKVEKKII